MAPDDDAVQKLISAAKATLRNLPPEVTAEGTHCVSAACLSQDSRIFTGINVSHFTGGPCAEPVAIGSAAASGVLPADLLLMVAVKRVHNDRDPAMKVINPCGRCRQQMFDLNSDIDVIVVDELGTENVVCVKELLPYAYVWKKERNQKVVERAVE
ncbi:hypothetical protein NA57DRAFT_60189 [Rhizodiscina lignyota]|uniref:CMP/dCMP-type deaminase domain-containing protein n=1 Tax=Rhizodiscina lignyota TaxID=1504668 RepID=A0A9P4I8Q7_9PEZI|nr:hypothetical protein NA57DRAFT_60189 [Rhizodiscina lignyota]